MKRRRFIGSVAGLLASRKALAQPARKLWRIGYLTPTRRDANAVLLAPLIEGLRARGYIEGETFRLEICNAEDDIGRLPALAEDLVRSRVDLIVAVTPAAIIAAARTTKRSSSRRSSSW
jgi:putative ABC transport system substrate-binding protein